MPNPPITGVAEAPLGDVSRGMDAVRAELVASGHARRLDLEVVG